MIENKEKIEVEAEESQRPDGRKFDQMRPVKITRNYTKYELDRF